MYAPQIYNILCFEHGNRRSIKYVGLDFLLHRHKKRRFLCKFVNMINAVIVILQIFSLPHNLGRVMKTHLMNINKENYIKYKG